MRKKLIPSFVQQMMIWGHLTSIGAVEINDFRDVEWIYRNNE